jgi:sugar phosphate isomerase/epimerase
MGFDAIEVSHSTDTPTYERLLAAHGVRLSSIHAPAPRVEVNGAPNSSLNLASIDEDERRLAIEHTKGSIERAEAAGARFVVVHLGGVGNAMFDAELRMRKLYDSGTRDGPEMEALRDEVRAQRVEMAPPYLGAARRTLEELVAFGQPRGVALGIENRLHHHEIPLPHEGLSLLEPYAPDVAGYWHAVGHAEVQARLGYVEKTAWLDMLGPRALGAHLHDVDGIGDHRAPGYGDVEWAYIARGLPAGALRVFEIQPEQTPERVSGAIAFLRERGVVA